MAEYEQAKLSFTVCRDGDFRFRLRKVVVELYVGEDLLDRTRMFAGPFFKRRLAKRKCRMFKRGNIMLAAMGFKARFCC